MITVLASGSKGNAYMLGRILIEAGIPYPAILKKIGYKRPHACLLTHFHGDHAKYAKDVAKHAVPIYASAGTLDAIDPDNTIRRAYTVHHGEEYQILDWIVSPYNSGHCHGALYYVFRKGSEKILFSTDNAFIYENHEGLTEIYIEANYSEDDLKEWEHLEDNKRIEAIRGHMSIEDCLKWLKKQDLSYTRKIVLLHMSSENGNLPEYIQRVQEATGIPTYGAMDEKH